MVRTLSQIREHNKRIGHFFFQKGLPPVIGRRGNFLMTRGSGGGVVVYKYNPGNGKIAYVKHFKNKADAINSIR